MDYDLKEFPPIEQVYNLGRSHATWNPNVGLCAAAFRAQPVEWMTDDDLEAWAMLPEDEAWRWYRLGFDAGPLQSIVELRQRHPELGALDA